MRRWTQAEGATVAAWAVRLGSRDVVDETLARVWGMRSTGGGSERVYVGPGAGGWLVVHLADDQVIGAVWFDPAAAEAP